VPLALSTGHEVGLGVTAAVFIAFALASSFLFPRFRPQYPGGGLLAFIVVSFVFFFGMLAAVEVFAVEKHEGGERVAETTPASPPTTTERTTTEQGATAPTTTQATTTQATTTQATTTTPTVAEPTAVEVVESEFKIVASKDFKAGEITFDVRNDGKIPHDLAIKGTPKKTKLIPPGGSAELTVTLKAGTYELYCTVPGHEQAGMKLNITVS
jgi:uncharacterized cupredoxin-like copper-binding protein